MPQSQLHRHRHLIVNLAPTGVVPTKKDNSFVPITPAEIAADVIACRKLGISSAHLHARDERGLQTHKAEQYADIIDRIRSEAPDLVLCVTCSGRTASEFSQRSEVLDLKGDLRPDMASLTLGSLNFARSASVNSPDMIKNLALKMLDNGIKPELEVFDVGMVNFANYLIEKDILRPPFYFNILLGNVSSAQANLLHVSAVLASLPPGALWSLAGFGADQLPMNALAIAMGGGVRVGLEDNLWMDSDRTAPASNPLLVSRVIELARLHERAAMPSKILRQRLILQDL
ncbi:MAG: 3-keto-5-aminohexanoate cleavage protein [Hyphomonadaceae bacterium]